jgi:hypothetical protein
MEQERVRALIASAENWRIARNIRDYILEVERGDSMIPPEERALYIKWALDQADRIDPLKQSPPSILDRSKEVEHLKKPGWLHPGFR